MAGRSVTALGERGQHVVVVAAREQLAEPSAVSLPEPAPAPGLILPDGSINWGCPCLGGMATGPCGNQFRDAFSCFHYSEAEPKGSDCYEKFSVMQSCMSEYPELYGKDDDELAAALDEASGAARDLDGGGTARDLEAGGAALDLDGGDAARDLEAGGAALDLDGGDAARDLDAAGAAPAPPSAGNR